MPIPRTALWASLLTLASLGGCANMSYYLQAVNGQMDVLNRAKPIEAVIDDPKTTPTLKEKLAAVRHIREFASRELGLPENGTFRSYADLERPYVVWNVFAAPELSVKPKEWCYVFAGCTNYRGYFFKAEAEAAAAELRREGYDVYVGGVPAYSTLGWLNDPVLNTFIHYPATQIAPLIFHELAHQVVYVPDDSIFNESFATTVEMEGARRWLAREGTAEQRAAFEAFEQRKVAFARLIRDYREKLKALYASSLSDEQKREQKKRVIQALREEYGRLKVAWGGFSGYDHWFAGDINNAQLASVALYTQMVPAFQALLSWEGGDLPRFYQAVKAIAKAPKTDRLAALQRLIGSTSAKAAIPDAEAAPGTLN